MNVMLFNLFASKIKELIIAYRLGEVQARESLLNSYLKQPYFHPALSGRRALTRLFLGAWRR